MNDKPTPPDGYEVMQGRDVSGKLHSSALFWYQPEDGLEENEWRRSPSAGLEPGNGNNLTWYAVPFIEASTPQKDPIGTDPKLPVAEGLHQRDIGQVPVGGPIIEHDEVIAGTLVRVKAHVLG